MNIVKLFQNKPQALKELEMTIVKLQTNELQMEEAAALKADLSFNTKYIKFYVAPLGFITWNTNNTITSTSKDISDYQLKQIKKAIDTWYKSWSKELICIIGPSGSGKTVLVKSTKKPLQFSEIISTTTRLPRVKEVDGVDYHFVNSDTFHSLTMVEEDEYAGKFYGIAQKDIEDAFKHHQHAFAIVTMEGAEALKQYCENTNITVSTVFIKTPLELLERRMIDRGDNPKNVNQRILNISQRNEMANEQKCDYVFNNSSPLNLSTDLFATYISGVVLA